MSNRQEESRPSQEPPAQAVILEMMWMGLLVSRALHVAAELNIADLLVAGPRSPSDLASATSANEDALRRLLRMLASHGVFSEDEDGRFGLTALADVLRSDVAGSIRDAIRMVDEGYWNTVGHLLDSVMTGRPAFEKVLGFPAFEYRARHPEVNERFARGMANISALENPAIARAYDFSPFKKVIDVGGGKGGFIAEVLKANPNLTGILCDEEHVVADPAYLSAARVADRCEIVGVNFFDAVPFGADVYILKRILHDWDDEPALRILRVCRNAIPAHGRVLGIDAVVPHGNTLHWSKDIDILMMVETGGRERTEEEFRDLYRKGGFTLTRVIPTELTLSIVEGTPS
jgi:hypothetical protein